MFGLTMFPLVCCWGAGLYCGSGVAGDYRGNIAGALVVFPLCGVACFYWGGGNTLMRDDEPVGDTGVEREHPDVVVPPAGDVADLGDTVTDTTDAGERVVTAWPDDVSPRDVSEPVAGSVEPLPDVGVESSDTGGSVPFETDMAGPVQEDTESAVDRVLRERRDGTNSFGYIPGQWP